MKKNFKNAVGVIMMTLCAVVMWSCSANSEYDMNGEKNVPIIKPKPRFLKCFVPRLDYKTSDAIQTRSSYNPAGREGQLRVISYQEFWAMLGTDTIKHPYSGVFEVNAFEVNKTRYAHNIDIFKNPVIKPEVLSDGRILNVVTFKDTETHDFNIALVEELPVYEEEYFQVGDSLFKLCQNERILLELIDSKIEDATSPDDKYNAYTVALYFQYGLAEGPDNKKSFLIRLPQVLVPKAGPDVPIPDDKHEVIAFEDENKGYDNVNDSVNNRWIDLVKVFTDGSREPFPRVAFVSKNRLFKPEYQIKNVTSFDWQSMTAKPFDPVKKGDVEKRENNIYVQMMNQLFTTYTDKGNCVFVGEYDGPAYFIDSLNVKHYFLDKEYTFEDDGWQPSDMQPTANMERKLLTSYIRGIFNGATLSRDGQIELRKVKEEKKVVGPWYSPLDSEESGLKYVSEGVYETFRTKYLLFSDNTKELVGRVPIRLYLSATAPAKATVDVTDWNITDAKAQEFDPRRQKARNDTTSYGVAKITPFLADYKTKTNKSTSPFTYRYDGAVVLIDPDTKEEIEFIPLTVNPEDLGGTKTLKDLMEEDDYERKLMTTSIKVTETHTNTFITKEAEILFRKAIEKEELLDWTVTKDLIDKGNGLWDTKADIVYTWKLKGTEHDPITQELDCSFKGEQKSHVILDKAEAPFNASNFNSAWSAETTSTPQQYVTLYTKTKSVSEDYTTLTDRYTAQMQRAVIKKTVGGKEIVVEMLAPSDMTFSHNAGNLVDGKRTTTDAGTTYDVYDHTGSVTATVTGNGKSQTQSAKDEKEIWVKHEDPTPAVECKYGFVDASLVFNPNVSIDNSKGGFHVCIALKGESEWIIAVTRTYGNPNAADFETYRFPFTQVPSSYKINSAIMWEGSWIPAYLSGIGQDWTYTGYNDEIVNMNMSFAETCGIKNFTGSSTAENTARLNYTYRVTDDGTLHVYNHKGGEVYSIK